MSALLAAFLGGLSRGLAPAPRRHPRAARRLRVVPAPPPAPAPAPEQHQEDGPNGRLLEVLARPISPTLALELYRESPRGACVACWRDLGQTLGAEGGTYFCSRKDGQSFSRCQQLRQKLRRCIARATQAAKGGRHAA